MALLEVDGIRAGYGRLEILKGVSLRVEPGQVVSIIGPNGAGKTTLLQILAGALEPDAGEVSADATGWVPQRPALYGKLSVAENLRLFARLEKVADVERTVRAMLELTALDAHDEAGTLSGGNRPAARRAGGRAGPAPARAAVGVRRRAARDRRLLHP
jgi:ABC-2 type transport system ATP-binding protein